jgi:membrane protease YdiL (CAAX protease family)
MKKFSKYYSNFVVIIILIVIPFSFLGSTMYRNLGDYIVGIYNNIFPIFLAISLVLIISSFYYLIKKNKKSFKYILKRGIISFIILFIVLNLMSIFQPEIGSPPLDQNNIPILEH